MYNIHIVTNLESLPHTNIIVFFYFLVHIAVEACIGGVHYKNPIYLFACPSSPVYKGLPYLFMDVINMYLDKLSLHTVL